MALAVTLLAGLVAGCSGDEPEAEDGPTASGSATESASEPATAAPSSSSPTNAAIGDLVEGFPTDVLPVLPGSEVTLSSVVPGQGVRQVSLAGTTGQPPEAVLAFYRDSLVPQGFVEAPAALPAGVAGATFSRGDGAEIVTLSVVTVEGQQQYTVGGQIAG